MSADLNSGAIESHDFEQHSEALAPLWQVNFSQLSKGAFHADLRYLQTDSFLLYTEHWNRSLQVEGESPEGYLMLGANSAPEFIWDGSQLSHQQLAIKHSKEAMDFIASGRHTVILIPYQNLGSVVGEERADALLSHQHTISCDPTLHTAFNRAIHQLTDRYQQSNTADQGARIAARIDREISKLLNSIIRVETAENDRSDQNFRREILTRALQITRNLRHPVVIPELAKQLGASQRTLESAFQDSFGLPPTRYLRRMRLNQVRKDLRRSAAEATSITKVGSSWGFTELGRMAVEYRQLFGESPSETLAASPNQVKSGLPSR
jgi:AraC family ethanolamine operon transcriptional activator